MIFQNNVFIVLHPKCHWASLGVCVCGCVWKILHNFSRAICAIILGMRCQEVVSLGCLWLCNHPLLGVQTSLLSDSMTAGGWAEWCVGAGCSLQTFSSPQSYLVSCPSILLSTDLCSSLTLDWMHSASPLSAIWSGKDHFSRGYKVQY